MWQQAMDSQILEQTLVEKKTGALTPKSGCRVDLDQYIGQSTRPIHWSK